MLFLCLQNKLFTEYFKNFAAKGLYAVWRFKIICSSELKAQLGYYGHFLSVVCLFVRLRSFETFDFCFRTTGPILTKHITKHMTLMCRGFMLIKNKGSHLLLKCKILLVSFRILLSKIQSARKASVYVEAYSGSVHLSLFKVWSPWVE